MDNASNIILSDDDVYRALVSTHDDIFSSKGLDFPALLVSRANEYLAKLGDRGATLAIEKLLHAGCKRLALAAVLNVPRLLAQFPDIQTSTFGSRQRIDQMKNDLEKTALRFEEIDKASFVEGGSQWPHQENIPTPSEMANHLRVYATILDPIPDLKAITNTRSIKDVERYALTDYVKRVTGNWHDRDIADVLTAATGSFLDEAAQRVWRHRKYAHITLPIDFVSRLAEAYEDVHDKKHPK